ncbi:MAG: YolD-like family protein [Limosilactobacillus sp.]|jgi:hypothetical protein|uniref:YolD-like family protein n=1 Tax=Limosilactobacillus sp. TaxID=2773925 RepID=UPI0025C1D10A|nr:YolD-like family protein [Limosilactobacillus sp.]MCI1974753.1 YolD-like family protein [Limosilactobacillus sp.]MCI2030533.1 YolD-like family protein [Limosilactobacillus sp.]
MDEKEIIERELFSDTSQYNDIIKRPYQQSKGHMPMMKEDRAGQFSPFAALTGFGSLIQKKAEIYAHKKYLSADEERTIFNKLQLAVRSKQPVTINYFNDTVGYYEEFHDQVSKIKPERGRVFFNDHSSVVIANIKQVRE